MGPPWEEPPSPTSRKPSQAPGLPQKARGVLGQSMALQGSGKPSQPNRIRATTIAPWEDPPNEGTNEISPWDEDPQARIAGTRPFNQSYFNQGVSPQGTPPARPLNSRGNSEEDLTTTAEPRRTSATSQSTTESGNARAAANKGGAFRHKSLKGFFGDDPVDEPKKNTQGQPGQDGKPIPDEKTARSNSLQTAKSGEERPLTPKPDVTPWDYQNFEDVGNFGSAPIRQDSRPSEVNGNAKTNAAPSTKRGFGIHRHSKSKDDPPRSQPPAPAPVPKRPSTSREPSSQKFPDLKPAPTNSTPTSSSSNLPRASVASTIQSKQETNGKPEKRGLFSKIRNRHKDKDPQPEPPPVAPPQPMPSPEEVQSRMRAGSEKRQSNATSFTNEPRDRETSVASVDSVDTIKPEPPMAKLDRTFTGASKASFFRHGKNRDRGMSYQSQTDEKPVTSTKKPPPGMFSLDMNFDDLSDFVSTAQTPGTAGVANPLGTPSQEIGAPVWDAPDSWAVKGQPDENANQVTEGAEKHLPPIEEEDGISYFMRVFRSDGTFSILSMTINATVSEVIQSLAKKSLLPDTIDNYHLLLRKNQLSRQLDSGERPVAMQKRLLIQAGYEESDQIEEVGRDDNSYLCKFTFSHEKQTGFGSGLENDPTFNKQQKFSHVDLSGRALVTIPIILYTKAPEIISLNLSRNLALSVPKDFITQCVSLREIKFAGNEAWKLPASLAWASRLQVLDLSNNRLEELDHAELHRLTGLVSLKLANNNITSLPSTYSHFRQLRSLNLSSNSLNDLPEQVCSLKALVDLDISFNKISSLPKISRLKTLERLWMTNNDLKGPFNESFAELQNLKEIDARFNAITSIDNVAKLPNLESLLVGHNNIAAFKGSFPKLRTLVLDHCPVTQFELDGPVPTLASMNIASAKLVEIKDFVFENMPNLQKLILDKNHFSYIPSQIGRLSKLEHLSMAKNRLNNIPATIGNLAELKYLNLRECNVKSMPPEIWYCKKLEMLNLSSNVLETFPKMSSAPPISERDKEPTTPGLSQSPSFDELGKLEDFQARRPSATSAGMMSNGSSPGGYRKGSVSSQYAPQGRKMSTISRTNTETSMATATRKDSNLSTSRLYNTFAGSLRYLYLADNRLEDEVFRELIHLPELRMLNLSYNEIDDFPQGVLRRWPQLTELYLSGNTLTSLPSDDLEENSNLRALFLNANRFQVLPAELCNVHKLSVLDVGSNSLKYNVTNWPYDWNWNRNTNLKYLNFSANRRLEIKPAAHSSQNQFSGMNGENAPDLTSFNSLKYLRVLGLMDVTLLTNSVPDDNEDRRVRTSASLAGALMYGMADTLGKNDHLSTIDLLKPNFQGHESEVVVALFDGQSSPSGGSKVSKYLHENFAGSFVQELKKLKADSETPIDALRRTFLSLNKEIANYANSAIENREHRLQNGHRGSTVANSLSADDLSAGSVATVLYVNGTDLYVANVGDIQAILIQSNGQHRELTRKHDPAEMRERDRIRAAGGYVSRQGKLNDILEVSRAFGYFYAMPSIIAAPYTMKVQISDSDELIILATKEFWDYITVDLAVDLARAEKADLMVAAQKLRDLAIAFGARDKMMVMVLGVSDLRKRNTSRFRGTSLSMAKELGHEDSGLFPSRGKTRKKLAGDSKLARLEEPEAPEGDVAICFTDIKNSTALWEILPVPMRSAIQLHNELMRRQLRILGGYEVKTEGDAFMCSFPTATSALLWCFSCQSHLLDLEWPTEILDTVHCQEKIDKDGNTIYRGLSVRMGIHWGRPVCEQDPITRRMDYFGPMVNKAARVSGIADGGQITVSTDFIGEIQRTLEAFADDDRRDSVGSDDGSANDDPVAAQIRRELRQLSTQGFEVKDLGERKLKGLENPEFIYQVYPHSLAGRLNVPPGAGDAPPPAAPAVDGEKAEPGALEQDSTLKEGLNLDEVWKLWDIALRLEMLCSCLEDPSRSQGLRKPELSLMTSMKERGGAISDQFMMNLLEHQVTRVENCASALQIRHMFAPLEKGVGLSDQGKPIKDIFTELAEALAIYKEMKEKRKASHEDEDKSQPHPG